MHPPASAGVSQAVFPVGGGQNRGDGALISDYPLFGFSLVEFPSLLDNGERFVFS